MLHQPFGIIGCLKIEMFEAQNISSTLGQLALLHFSLTYDVMHNFNRIIRRVIAMYNLSHSSTVSPSWSVSLQGQPYNWPYWKLKGGSTLDNLWSLSIQSPLFWRSSRSFFWEILFPMQISFLNVSFKIIGKNECKERVGTLPITTDLLYNGWKTGWRKGATASNRYSAIGYYVEKGTHEQNLHWWQKNIRKCFCKVVAWSKFFPLYNPFNQLLTAHWLYVMADDI